MAHRLTFLEDAQRLSGYGRAGAGRTRFGRVEIGVGGPHDVTVLGDGVPTVHLDGVLLGPGTARILLDPPGRITVDDAVGTVSHRRGLRLTRAAKTVTAEVAGRTYQIRLSGLAQVVVTRLEHGVVAVEAAFRRFRLEDRADPTDLAVALALTDAIDRDSLSLVPGR